MTLDPVDLKNARVLISNDDGIHAPGIQVLERVVRKLAKDVWVVAPAAEQSAASHSLTLRKPLRYEKLDDRHFAVTGTPTDSVLLGVQYLMRDHRPDIVISGINKGGNLGEDVTYSGTIAAAMEGTLLGIRSIALSQQYDNRSLVRWETAEVWTAKVLEILATAQCPHNVLFNVNFPDRDPDEVAGIEVAFQGKRKIGGQMEKRLDPRDEPYFWVSNRRVEDRYLEGSDLATVTKGAVAVTPLSTDLSHGPTLKTLREALR